MKSIFTKTILVIFAVAAVVSFINIPVSHAADYDYAFVSQSAYPQVAKGGTATLMITLKNTGGIAWYNFGEHPTRLGTSHDTDRASALATTGNWLSPNRIGMTEDTVNPGENGTFTFTITAPNADATYREYFQPVIEGYQWMKDIGIYLDITVGAGGTPPQNPGSTGTYDYDFVTQSAYPTVASGAKALLRLTLKNTGTATWVRTGNNALHLGTSSPMDRNSGFYTDNDGWVATNRIIMDQDSVAPGANATFTFNVTGYSQEGIYNEYFRPVAENITWLRDIGIYWGITVTKATPPTNQILDHLTITPASASINTNATQEFNASAYDSANAIIQNVHIDWSLVAGGGTISVISADSNGSAAEFTAGATAGTFANTVKAEATLSGITKSALASVTVSQQQQGGGGGGGGGTPSVSLESIAITPDTATLRVGDTQQFTATGTYSNHSTSNISSSVNWSVVSSGGAGTISGAGLFRATAAGDVKIHAIKNGISDDTAVFTINPADLTQIDVNSAGNAITVQVGDAGLQFAVTAHYSDGTTAAIDAGDVAWSVTPGTGTGVIDNTGLMGGLTTGTVTVHAVYNTVSGNSVPITVSSSGVATQLSIISGNSQSRPAGSMLNADFVVGLADVGGNTLTTSNVSILFSVTAQPGITSGSLAPVSPLSTNGSGQISTRYQLGLTAGTYEITFTSAGLSPVTFSAVAAAVPPPTINALTSADITAHNQTIIITFSQDMDATLAGDINNYLIYKDWQANTTSAIPASVSYNPATYQTTIVASGGTPIVSGDGSHYMVGTSGLMNAALTASTNPDPFYTNNGTYFPPPDDYYDFGDVVTANP